MRRAFLRDWMALAAAMVIALTGGTAMAQDDGAEGEDPGYRTYSTRSIERPDFDKPVDQRAREESERRVHEAACQAGDAAQCGELAKDYELGRGAPQVRPIAAILYSEACAAGDAESCFRSGRLNLSAEDKEEALPDAVADLERACDLGSVDGCISFAQLLDTGYGLERDEARAEAVLRKVCPNGGSDACLALATTLLQREAAPDRWGEAVLLLDTQCRASVAEACTKLHALYYYEDFPIVLPHEPEVLYLGCSAGDAGSCKMLGDRSFNGEGVVRDEAYALAAYERACALESYLCEIAETVRSAPGLSDQCVSGDVAACAKMGEIASSSKTPYFNAEAAGQYFAYACENGLIDACADAGQAALYAITDPASDTALKADRYLQIGCDAGRYDACSALADALYNGRGLSEDKPRSWDVVARICAMGFDRECEQLETHFEGDPGAPLPVAGSNFLPPDDPETGDSPLADRLAEMRAELDEPENKCVTNNARFRGREYSDTICPTKVRVINGRALRPGEAPWQALLWRPERLREVRGPLSPQGRVLCGGSVIARGWVLTAAHCLTDYGRSILGRGYTIRLGVHNPRADEGVSYPIIDAFKHPNYDSGDFAFDIALIRYDANRWTKASVTNSIGTILPDTRTVEGRPISAGMPVYVYGWGWTVQANGTSTAELRSARLELTSLGTCTRESKYRNEPGEAPKLNSALCAGSRNNASSCKGDSGGPLIYYGDADNKPRVVGVVSTGIRCGQTGRPGLYTRVGNVYDWIEGVMSGRRR